MAKPKKRRAKKRKAVNRAERVAATPETLAKLKPWPMQQLLQRGPENGGLSSDQFEAGVQIVEAFKIITHNLGYRPLDLGRVGHGTGEIGPKQARLWNLYVEWGNEFQRRTLVRPHVIVEMVEDERPIDAGALPLLCRAASLWDETAREYDRRQRKPAGAEPNIPHSGHLGFQRSSVGTFLGRQWIE